MVAADPQAAVRALGGWDRGGRARELLRSVLAAGGVVRKATRREQVVVVPVDLREALAAVLHGRRKP